MLVIKWNEPSPLANPATQKGSEIFLNLYSGLLTVITLPLWGGKAFFKFSERPQLRELFKPTNFNIPSFVKCSFCLMISKHCLNNKKSDTLQLISGYFSKWSMITSKSIKDSTVYVTELFPVFLIVPTPATRLAYF